MKKSVKIIIAIVIILAVIIGGFVAYASGISITHKGVKYAEKYSNDDSVNYVYFTDKDFGDYDSIEYSVKDTKGFVRTVGSMYTVTYTDSQYENQLKVVNALDYLDAPYQQEGSSTYIIPAEKVESNGWTVRVVKNEDETTYPKNIEMIGTNDSTKTIVYMYFTDFDLDYISETGGQDQLKQFIEDNFAFKFE